MNFIIFNKLYLRDKFEEMELDMEEINERMDKTTGKLDVLGGNHDLVKRKLSKMASIIEGFFIVKSSFKYCSH